MAVTKASPLKTASSSGALCVVVETPLEATTHDEPKLKKDTPAINIPNAETTGDATERKDFTNPEEEAPKQAIRRTTTDAFKGIQKLQGKRIKEWRKLFSLQVYLTPFHERDTFKPTEGTFSIHGRKVHGICRLPKGYGFQMLPIGTAVYERGQEEEDAKEDGNFVKRSTKRIIAALKCMKSRKRTDEEKAEEKTEKRECSINSSYSFAKASVAIFQTVYASFTLYRTRGDQLNRYGYAAFGLTVAPYVVMSVMNLVCAVLTPDYDHVYMIESPVMKQARDAGGTFVGMVGSLKIRGAASETSSVYRPSASGRASTVAAPLTNGVSSIPSSTHAPEEASAVKTLPTTATAAEEGIAPAAAAHTPNYHWTWMFPDQTNRYMYSQPASRCSAQSLLSLQLPGPP